MFVGTFCIISLQILDVGYQSFTDFYHSFVYQINLHFPPAATAAGYCPETLDTMNSSGQPFGLNLVSIIAVDICLIP